MGKLFPKISLFFFAQFSNFPDFLVLCPNIWKFKLLGFLWFRGIYQIGQNASVSCSIFPKTSKKLEILEKELSDKEDPCSKLPYNNPFHRARYLINYTEKSNLSAGTHNELFVQVKEQIDAPDISGRSRTISVVVRKRDIHMYWCTESCLRQKQLSQSGLKSFDPETRVSASDT